MEAGHPVGSPVQAGERFESLDVLRGAAVLGIFAINIWHFALPESFYLNPTALGGLEGADKFIWHATALFVNLKFLTLFSLLFGAGIAMMAVRAGGARHRRRMVILLLFGLCHAYLIWPGDILVTYAICGLLIAPVRHWSVPSLWVFGIVFVTLGGLIEFLLGQSLSFADAETIQTISDQSWAPPTDVLEAEIALRAEGSWADQIARNFAKAVALQTVVFLLGVGWRTLGIMALGMALYRMGVLTARWSLARYGVMAVVGLGLGLPIVEAGIAFNEGQDWDLVAAMSFGSVFNYWGSLLVAGGYIGVVVGLVRARLVGPVRTVLAATGRMAFTNYIAQSLIATTLMYGFGFGLFGSLSLTSLLGIVIAVWTAQLIWSPLWLSRFERGPLEALWRRLTYGPWRA